jgi:hypothetical protein
MPAVAVVLVSVRTQETRARSRPPSERTEPLRSTRIDGQMRRVAHPATSGRRLPVARLRMVAVDLVSRLTDLLCHHERVVALNDLLD